MDDLLVGVHTASIYGADDTTQESVDPNYTSETVTTASLDNLRYGTIIVNFTASKHFDAGQIVGISIDGNTAPNNAIVCCVWEYDVFNVG